MMLQSKQLGQILVSRSESKQIKIGRLLGKLSIFCHELHVKIESTAMNLERKKNQT